MNVPAMGLEERLKTVIVKAAGKLPGEIGQRLLQLVSPAALAAMAAVVAIWAGAHFFGVGEIADVIMLVTGVIAIGTSAIEGGRKLIHFGVTTARARNDGDLNQAATDLAGAVATLGIDVVLALLFKGRPRETFGEPYKPNVKLPPFREAAPHLPDIGPTRMMEARIVFTKTKMAGQGGTDGYNVARIGRDFYPGGRPVAELTLEVRRTVFHERVHQRIRQAFSLLGKPGLYVQMSAYKRSVILRYIEEAAAETYGQVMTGAGRSGVIEGIKFPLNGNYGITLTRLGSEGRGILLGPVTVGGLVYHAYYGLIDDDRPVQRH